MDFGLLETTIRKRCRVVLQKLILRCVSAGQSSELQHNGTTRLMYTTGNNVNLLVVTLSVNHSLTQYVHVVFCCFAGCDHVLLQMDARMCCVSSANNNKRQCHHVRRRRDVGQRHSQQSQRQGLCLCCLLFANSLATSAGSFSIGCGKHTRWFERLLGNHGRCGSFQR